MTSPTPTRTVFAWTDTGVVDPYPYVRSLAYALDAATADGTHTALRGMRHGWLHDNPVSDLLDTELDDTMDQVVRDEVLP